jgi:hypothetical protein
MQEGEGICILGMVIVGLPPMLILLTAMAPGYVERARAVMRRRPGRSFLLGLVNFVFFAALSLLTGMNFAPVAFLGAFALVIVLPLFLLIGLLAAAGLAGERIWAQIASRPGTLLGSLVLGTFALGLTVLVPIFGWLLFLGLTLTGLGASILALFQRRQPEGEPQPTPPKPVDLGADA